MGAQYPYHHIYCDLSFRDLIDLVARFLADRGYAIDTEAGPHYLTSIPQLNISEGNRREGSWPTASICTSPYRKFVNSSDAFYLRVVHMRWAWRHSLLGGDSFPIHLRRHFEICPNYIEIESHRRWMDWQKDVGEDLASWLRQHGHAVYVRTLEGALLDLIEQAYDDPADKAEDIHQLVRLRFRFADLPALNNSSLPSSFYKVVPYLEQDSIIALRTGELLRSFESPLPDWSAAIIEYCKAVEIEITEKCLAPLRRHWQGSSGLPKNLVPRSLPRLYRYIFKNGRPLEIGSLGAELEELNTAIPSNEFVRSAYAYLPNQNSGRADIADLSQALLLLARSYRNPAAHKEIMTRQHLEECRTLVVGTDTTPGLLTSLLEWGADAVPTR